MPNELKIRMQHCHEIARNNIVGNKRKSINYYDRNLQANKFKLGDKVLLKNEACGIGKCKKLLPSWSGPYEIIEVNSDVNYTISYRSKPIVVHISYL